MNYDVVLNAVKTLDEGYKEGQQERVGFFERAHAAGVAIRDYRIAYGLMGPATAEEMTPSEVKW